MGASREHQPQCLSCGYSLAGLPSGLCPECGREFDLDDPTTYGPNNFALAKNVAEFAPPRYFNILYASAVCASLVVFSSPNGSVSDFVGGLLGLIHLTVLMAWAIGAASQLFSRYVLWFQARFAMPKWRAAWLWIPIVFAVYLLAHNSGAVWHARWALSRGSFERLAQTPKSEWKPGWYGLFHVTAITHKPDGSSTLDLGFPDWYSQGCAEFRHGALVEPYGPDLYLGGPWWITWNPT